MTPELFRMAKSAMRITNTDLARLTGVKRSLLKALDGGSGDAATVEKVRAVLETRGIVFVKVGEPCPGPAVALVFPR